jgi:MFS family permease
VGRKRALTLLGIAYFVSSLGCGLAWNWPFLLTFRFLGGIAIGVASVVAPMYIAEIAPPAFRGRLVAVSQFNILLGILAAYFTNYVIALIFASPGADGVLVAWRWMFGIVAVPSGAFFLMVLQIPESPRWLVKQHRSTELWTYCEGWATKTQSN